MIDILKKAAYEGGKVTLKYFQKELEITNKSSHQSIVTQADVESQKVIQETIIRMMLEKGYKEEEIGFVGEENLHKPGKYTFVIDPLDGTTNFASGLEQYAVFVALFIDGQLMAGVVYVPTTDTYYFAEKGKGAYRQKNNLVDLLKVEKKPLSESIFDTYISSSPAVASQLLNFTEKIAPHIRGIRMMGGNHQIYFIENKFQIILIGRYYLWDIAANKIIVEEAGGMFYDWDGKKFDLDITEPKKYYSVINCHPDLKEEVMKIMKG